VVGPGPQGASNTLAKPRWVHIMALPLIEPNSGATRRLCEQLAIDQLDSQFLGNHSAYLLSAAADLAGDGHHGHGVLLEHAELKLASAP
jgi:hypothetical protein